MLDKPDKVASMALEIIPGMFATIPSVYGPVLRVVVETYTGVPQGGLPGAASLRGARRDARHPALALLFRNRPPSPTSREFEKDSLIV